MFRVLFVIIVAIAATLPVIYADCGHLFFPENRNYGKVNYKYSTTPWNAGVYRKDESNKYDMICCGSLISPKLVVTSAQFFWEKGLPNKIIRDGTQYYKIAVGKYKRDYSVMDNEFTQIIDVKLIYLQDNFEAKFRYYADDIAVIVLENDVIVSDAVMPVCIDWTEKYTIPSGTIGKIVGWGLTEKLKPSPVLLERTLPYIDRLNCHHLITGNNQLQAYVPSDKFCGLKGPGFRGGEAGFGGAGLTFAQADIYYLAGIMSIKINETVEILTDVSKHIPWLRNIYSQYYQTGCGRLFTPKNKNRDYHGVEVKFSTAPWNVGVYIRDASNKYVMICGGTLVAPNLVISAAQFFWEKESSNKIIRDTQNYKIAVGKYKRNYSIMDNEFTQIINVELIYLEENYDGQFRYYANDIAIIKLKNNVILSDAVMPVCIDWTGKRTIPNGTKGKIVGWGMDNLVPSPVLLELSLPYTDRTSCHNLNKANTKLQKYVPSDKFCGIIGPEFRGGEAGFGGAGLTFENENGLYFLVGVVSITYNHSIEILTDVNKHIPWIHNIYSEYGANGILNNKISTGQLESLGSTSSNSFKTTTSAPVPIESLTQVTCTIPFVNGSIYSLISDNSNQNKVLLPGTLVSLDSKVEETCEKGYHKVQTKRNLIKCEESGEWFPSITESEPLCIKKCRPMESDSLDLKCTYNGLDVDCADPAIYRTILQPKCKVTHGIKNGQLEVPVKLVCRENGEWSGHLYECIPKCGRTNAQITTLIAGGQKVKYGTAPWNAALYHKENNTYYDLICGGTIIDPNLVISAAHCFWNSDIGKLADRSNYSNYQIGVSKYERNYFKRDNEFTQILEIRDIHVPKNYQGQAGFHENDIAIIVLSKPIKISNQVLPACMDWNNKFSIIKDGTLGKVVGWGLTEKKTPSPILLEVSLPYIHHDKCMDISANDFKNYVTKDKFCAGYQSVSGTAVDQGDSGAGLTFVHSDSHFLTGIVSLKETVDNTFATFTSVSYHRNWIETIYLEVQ
ncbi:Peptidase S1, PA clan,Serine proteases, trypsin family, histidine active site,Serine proteases, trypsin [Cinara cedri]|uniref:Peptidase S1, PA clan,Serine proteases, trypsin family, histidine active site,Serine proteases, trypsin n=1 Tax=Cinara cedri TaxID=506608 RepID=A0A5E4M1N7_9HEMI|nr:Peptidase S1, PA clan,Serine proteases, trypsin family, histidine active site,Serine proteases, trypsin [Cinara cedri]